MKKNLLILIFAITAFFAWGGEPLEISGTVLCKGMPVNGVAVTDGESITVTDTNGKYSFTHNGKGKFVYISVPSGYDAEYSEGIIKFFAQLEAGKTIYDFALSCKTSDDTNHAFITIADPQIWHKKEFSLLKEAMDDIRATTANYKVPLHGICCGDIISHEHTLYGEYKSVVATSGLRFYNAMGNHDMTLYDRTHETSLRKYEDTFGPAYYSYNVGKVHYVVLNDNFYIGRDYFYIGYLDERQMAWIEKDLALVKPGSTVIVTLHIPTSCTPEDRKTFKMEGAGGTLTNHRALYKMLEPFNVHILSGHTHTTYNQQITPNIYEHVTAALSGAWWQGSLCTDGTPKGYGVYEVNGSEIKWHYKSTGHNKEYQMVLYNGNIHKEFEGFIVANIWNSDPAWKVEMYQGGKKICDMERFEAYDPAAKAMYANTEKMDHKWIYPSKSDHFYKGAIPADETNIEIVATDSFSNVYRSSLK